MSERARAERFLHLHDGPDVLVVGSVWDAASAVVFAREGFPALATSSAGVAFSLGYADGEHVARDELFAAIMRIVRAVDIPVSADIESGYGRTPDEVAETCRRVQAAGAVGVNLEDAARDGLVDAEAHADKIRAVRATVGAPFVINGRTDVYLLGRNDFADAVRRLNLYRAAGADCLFAPGITDRDTIARLVGALDGPLNVLATAGTPAVAELAALGVRRVSQGSGPARAALAATRRIARELKAHGRYDAYTADTISYADANALFPR